MTKTRTFPPDHVAKVTEMAGKYDQKTIGAAINKGVSYVCALMKAHGIKGMKRGFQGANQARALAEAPKECEIAAAVNILRRRGPVYAEATAAKPNTAPSDYSMSTRFRVGSRANVTAAEVIEMARQVTA